MNKKTKSFLRKLLGNPKGKQFLHQLYGTLQNFGMSIEPEFSSRYWSNTELARFAEMFNGDVVNVSGWMDIDRSSRPQKKYREYFSNSNSYSITNYPGARGQEDNSNSIPLDLEKPVPETLHGKFDVVFNHTTLEHVFEVNKAIDCLADLSKDIVILVVPFIQHQHYDEGSYGDYWRFSPMLLDRQFSERGFTTVYVSANDQSWFPVYIFFIASRHPEKWITKFPANSTDLLNKKLCADYFHW